MAVNYGRHAGDVRLATAVVVVPGRPHGLERMTIFRPCEDNENLGGLGDVRHDTFHLRLRMTLGF